MAEELRPRIIRDPNVDWLLEKIYIPAIDVVKNVASTTNALVASLTVGWSIGSPTYTAVPGGGRYGGILLTALTPTIDYLWRVPSSVDKNHAIYFRHHWTTAASGLTPSIAFGQYVATISSATSLVSSPTAVLNVVNPLSSNGGATGTAWVLNISGRGSVQPIATGLAAFQAMDDRVEFIHTAIQANSVNFTIAANNVIWLGMDIEYTPRKTYGDGSRREGRKMETNLGFQEIGAAQNY